MRLDNTMTCMGLTLFCASAVAQPLAVQPMHLVEQWPSAPVRDRMEKYWVQALPAGGIRVAGKGVNGLLLHDIDSAGVQLGSLPIEGRFFSNSRARFLADGVGGTYVWSATDVGCRITRVDGQREVVFQREVTMPGSAVRQIKGGDYCGGFAAFSDGSTVIADFYPPVVLVDPAGLNQSTIPLPLPEDVDESIGSMMSNGQDLLVPGVRYANGPAAAATAYWLGAYTRSGEQRWEIELPVSGRPYNMVLAQDGQSTAILMKMQLENPLQTIVRFAVVDADGALLLAPTDPMTLFTDYQVSNFIADQGRLAANFDGVQTLVRWPTGQTLNLLRGGPVAFGAGNTLWRGGSKDCDLFSNCQGLVERISANGQVLETVTLPDAFYVEGVAAIADGRVAAAGIDRFLNGSGDFVEGSAYAMQLSTSGPLETDLFMESRASPYDVVKHGERVYAVIDETGAKHLVAVDGRGRKLWEQGPTSDLRLLAANARGVWQVGSNPAELRFARAADGAGSGIALSQYDVCRTSVVAGNSIWVWMATDYSDGSPSRLRRYSESGELLYDRDTSNASLIKPLLVSPEGDYVMFGNETVQRFNAAGSVLFSTPSMNSYEVIKSTGDTLLLGDQFRLRKLDRNGVQLWSTPVPISSIMQGYPLWDSALDSDVRLRVIVPIFSDRRVVELERWNVGNGTLLRRTVVNIDTLQSGVIADPYYNFGQVTLDSAGELLLPVRSETDLLLRFVNDQPSSFLRFNSRATLDAHYFWPNNLGEIQWMGAPPNTLGPTRMTTWSNGLQRDGFE